MKKKQEHLQKSLLGKLNIGDVVVLLGDLGAGKTKFVEGFLEYFNLQNEISSPTFNIVNEYRNDSIAIFHFDVYRLSGSDEFYEIGGDEFFSQGISLIEWGNIIDSALPKEKIIIKFEQLSSNINERVLNIEATGKKYEEILRSLEV